MKAGPAPIAFSGFHEPVPYIALPCLALVQKEEELGPTSPLYAMFFLMTMGGLPLSKRGQ